MTYLPNYLKKKDQIEAFVTEDFKNGENIDDYLSKLQEAFALLCKIIEVKPPLPKLEEP